VSELLSEAGWVAREQAHERRVQRFLDHHAPPHADQPHPVWGFLFTYYNLQPRQLRRWHPGYAVALTGERAHKYLGRAGYGTPRWSRRHLPLPAGAR
jgi:hypothetical protein